MLGLWTRSLHALHLYWVKSKVDFFAVQKRYSEAIQALNELPFAEFERADWAVWRLQLHHLAGDDQWVADNAREIIGKVTSESRLSLPVRSYLSAYVSFAARLSVGNLILDRQKAARLFPPTEIDARQVPKKWVVWFPMTLVEN